MPFKKNKKKCSLPVIQNKGRGKDSVPVVKKNDENINSLPTLEQTMKDMERLQIKIDEAEEHHAYFKDYFEKLKTTSTEEHQRQVKELFRDLEEDLSESSKAELRKSPNRCIAALNLWFQRFEGHDALKPMTIGRGLKMLFTAAQNLDVALIAHKTCEMEKAVVLGGEQLKPGLYKLAEAIDGPHPKHKLVISNMEFALMSCYLRKLQHGSFVLFRH